VDRGNQGRKPALNDGKMKVKRILKRIIDLGIALPVLVIFSPLMTAAAAAIVLNSGFPVFFRQQRPGLDEKPFTLIKFRTMKDAYDDSGKPLPDEQRITPVGKWLRKLSLDELPQFFNVLKGDMSIVGPRPLLMEYLPLYNKRQKKRHLAKPGITGWAQVNGRNALTWEQKFEFDVWYVENRSLGLDFKIMGMTFLKVFKGEGISAEGYATMPVFTGKPEKENQNGSTNKNKNTNAPR